MTKKPERGKSSKNKGRFTPSKGTEATYAAQLRKVAKAGASIITSFVGEDGIIPFDEIAKMNDTVTKYLEALDPWVRRIAWDFIQASDFRNERVWAAHAADISEGLRELIESSDISSDIKRLFDEQVTLIKSLPLEAAQRAQEYSQEALLSGERYTASVQRIMETESVSLSRATLIARTEAGRAMTILTQARAESIGSEGYIWQTVEDVDVRKSHKAMNGKFVRWDSPPTLDGLTGHAGALPNCRCIPLPAV